jgi:hypothetical protein
VEQYLEVMRSTKADGGVRPWGSPLVALHEPGERAGDRSSAPHYAVGVRFIYANADELGAIRLGAGERPRLRFDPAVVRERWASVNALPTPAHTRRRGPTTKLRVVPSVELLDFERDD